MLLLAFSLVVGQDRIDPAQDSGTWSTGPELAETRSLLTLKDKARLAAIRHVVDSVAPLADKVELTIDVSVNPVNDEMSTGNGLLE